MGYGFDQSDAKLRPLVKTHSETGRKTLTIRTTRMLFGLDEAESEKLLDELVDFAASRPRIYQHKWSPGDVVVWDNRNLMRKPALGHAPKTRYVSRALPAIPNMKVWSKHVDR